MTEYGKLKAESLYQLANLTEHAGQELMQMFDDYSDAPGGKYEFPATAIYRVSSLLRILSHELEDEAEWYKIMDK